MRSVIAYASPAWFIPQHKRHNLGLTKGRLETLELLENKCLVQVAGAYQKTDRMVLRKELNIESIEDYFGRIGATYRMKNIGSAYLDALAKAQQGEMRTRQNHRCKFQNPYVLLYGKAKQELEMVKAQYTGKIEDNKLILQQVKQAGSIPEVAKLIAKHNMEQCTIKCAEKWKAYVIKKSNNRSYIPTAYKDGWGPQSLKYYRHLDRAESTMLIQCRTGAIGLNSWLNKMNSDKKTVRTRLLEQSQTSLTLTAPVLEFCSLSVQAGLAYSRASVYAMPSIDRTAAKSDRGGQGVQAPKPVIVRCQSGIAMGRPQLRPGSICLAEGGVDGHLIYDIAVMSRSRGCDPARC